MNNILITIKKELRSMFRDKKTVMRLLLFPIIIPVMIIVYGELYKNLEEEDTTTYTIGINFTLDETTKQLFEASNLIGNYQNNKDDLIKLYNNKEIDAYLIYDESLNKYTIYYDESTTNGLSSATAIESYLESLSTYLTNSYLIEHNINLEEAYDTFTIEYESISKQNYLLSIIISVSVTYLIMSIVVATGNMATGTTATEKENGTLETLLTFPISKNELILGKYLSSAILGLIASLISFILMIAGIVIAKHYYTMFDGTEFLITVKLILICLTIIVTASLFIAGIALFLCGRSKSYKEAQSSLSFLNFITLIPLILSMSEVEIKTIYYLIPIFNHEQVILDIFNHNLEMNNFILTVISSIIYIIIVIKIVIKAYNSEDILYNN